MSVMASAAAERAALGQGGRGPGERREVDPSAHQGVIEHHNPERAFDLRIQVRHSPWARATRSGRTGADLCAIQPGCPTDGG
jgi:hypothetical protein